MASQEELYQLRAETKEAFDDAKALEERWRVLEKEQRDVYQVCYRVFRRCNNVNDALIQRFSPQFLQMRLRHSITQLDDASEALASAFIAQSTSKSTSSSTETPEFNGRELDDFVKEFKELRKVYHKRVIWGDRWSAGKVDWRDE